MYSLYKKGKVDVCIFPFIYWENESKPTQCYKAIILQLKNKFKKWVSFLESSKIDQLVCLFIYW